MLRPYNPTTLQPCTSAPLHLCTSAPRQKIFGHFGIFRISPALSLIGGDDRQRSLTTPLQTDNAIIAKQLVEIFRSAKMMKKTMNLEHFNFLKKLKKLDLAPIAYQLMHPDQGNGWTKEKTTQALLRYLMFLCLIYLYPQQKIVPTVEIDRVWHHHILDTSKYAADCEMLFGRFIHHFPYFGQRGESDRLHWQTAFSQSQNLFQQHFGVDILSQNDEDSPARCEPLLKDKNQASDRPIIDIELATSWDEAIADEFLG